MRGRAWARWALCGLWLAGAAAASPSKRLWTEAKQRKLAAQRSELVQVARKAMPAVVSITTEQLGSESAGEKDAGEAPSRGLGAGFIIHPDGYILTASHVIESAREIRVTVVDAQGDSRDYVAQLVGQDIPTDFAILKINAGRKLPILPLGSAEHVEVADWVVAIGNPFGLGHSVTVGVVSYKGRTDVTPNGRSGYFDYLQTDASINPGNSGGPVVDLTGEVVAIANAVNVAGQGIGFAIPIDIAKAVIPQLMERGSLRRGWMGVSVQDLTPELAASFGLRGPHGVLVSDVVDGGPGSAAGLRAGDVIQSFGPSRVSRAHALRWQVATAGVGNTVELRVRREGRPLSLRVKLQDLPGEGQGPAHAADQPSQSREEDGASLTTPVSSVGVDPFGAELDEVDEAASLQAGLAVPFGALVRQVKPTGLMGRAGCQAGDVILKVNNREVTARADFFQALASLSVGTPVRLFVRRGVQTLYLAFRKP